MQFDGPTILMCPPDFYGIEYEINPWMSRSRQSDHDTAIQQWKALRDTLAGLGARIELQSPVKGLPDLVFTANAGLVWRELVFLSQFRHKARQGETPVDRKWFEEFGFETMELPPDHDFEGAGDALFCGDTLVAGYLIRSEVRAMQYVADRVGCRAIPVQLVDDRYYHLDTCFCPFREDAAIWYPPAFDEYGRAAIAAAIPNLIEVEQTEAERFACNAVVVGNHVVLNTGCERLEESLGKEGFETLATPLDEFIKAGGSAKCLTMRLDGEDAARWPER